MSNASLFESTLAGEYVRLFESDPDYAYSAARISPDLLASKMVASLQNGTANKDGKAIKAACKKHNINYTYKAIRSFLATGESYVCPL